MKKRIFSILLSIGLMLTLLPGTVLADDKQPKDVWIDNTVDNSVSIITGVVHITGSGGTQAGYYEGKTVYEGQESVTYSNPRTAAVQGRIDAAWAEVYNLSQDVKDRGKRGEYHMSMGTSTGRVWDHRKYETIEEEEIDGQIIRTHIATGDYGKETFYRVEANGWVAGYDITTAADPAEGGTATSDLTASLSGETVTFTAEPADGRDFQYWEVVNSSGTSYSWNPNYSYTMPDSDVTARAVFTSGPVYLCTSRSDGGILKVESDYNFFDDALMTNMSFVSGSQVTMVAEPDEGYKFAGYYEGIRQMDPDREGYGFVTGYDPEKLISSDKNYTFTATENRNIYALFERDDAASYDLTFAFTDASGTSTPLADLVSSITVNGENWPLPASGMDVTGKIPEGAVTAVVKAADSAAFFGASSDEVPDYNWQTSDSNTTYTFSFTMPVAASQIQVTACKTVDINFDANGGTKGPAWWGDVIKYPAHFADFSTAWTVESSTVDPDSGENIVVPPAGYVYAGQEVIDKNGTHHGEIGESITGLDITGGITIRYLWEKMPALTLHWSSIDGEDLMEPIVIENIEKGTQVYEALGTIGLNMMSHPFEKEGYIAADYKVNKPITDYADRGAMEADWVDAFAPIESDMDIYCIMMKKIDAAEITIAQPVCGTEVTTSDEEDPWSQTNPPGVSVPDGAGYKLYSKYEGASPAIWVNSVPDYEPFEGKIIGGKEHAAEIWLDTDFGYIFSNDVGITVNGGTLVEKIRTPGSLAIIASVTAVHDPAEAVIENIVEPTCAQAGSHDEVVYCKGCGAALSRNTVTEPALGHVWGEWIVDKDATEEEAGLCHRECSRCGEREEEVIPMIIASYNIVEGDGATWYIGSSDSLTFTFKRSVNDAATFGNFQRIEVDGKEVASADYTAEEGSVIITLKQEFLATLEAGVHKLTAFFENGKSADATFTVKAKDEAPADDQKPDAPKTAPKTGDTSREWLYIGIAAAALLCAALTLVIYKRKKTER